MRTFQLSEPGDVSPEMHPHSRPAPNRSGTRRASSLISRLSDPARRPLPAGREPFTRLQFYSVPHGLTKRLTPYEASASPSMFRYSHWATLRYWMLLLDEDDEVLITFAGLETEIPDPDVWFGRVKV